MNQAFPKLSICIATFNRGAFIAETLDTIVRQLTPDVELLVLGGASADGTDAVMKSYAVRHPQVHYVPQTKNSGIDRDYDNAVMAAHGEYVWLMTDDDLLKPLAVARVLSGIQDDPDVVLVNAETWNADFSKKLDPSFLNFCGDRSYDGNAQSQFFSDTGSLTSFIGSVVIRRSLWMAREREPYYGSLFVHVGVMFQAPRLQKTKVIAEPLIQIRYGNAMWTSRGFEIWLFLWPQLIWSFDFPDAFKAVIYPREPWRMLRKLVLYRASGGYSLIEYRKFIRQRVGICGRFVAWAVAVTPARLMNFVALLLCLTMHRNRIVMYDIVRSANAGMLTRVVARVTGL
jgi:glycosyltransferase involved in cell wall biosynthesis